MYFQTADLVDDFFDEVEVGWSILNSYGSIGKFFGPIETIRTFEDNSKVRAQLESPGHGRILVVDGGASLNCALLGDSLAGLAAENGWKGIIINGCIRDRIALSEIPIGIMALGTCPKKSIKQNRGEVGLDLFFANMKFAVGMWLYCDEDGMLGAGRNLLASN
ncbi:MAG: ribonuclease E activity regulator RraA [Oligoflexales bacterium]